MKWGRNYVSGYIKEQVQHDHCGRDVLFGMSKNCDGMCGETDKMSCV